MRVRTWFTGALLGVAAVFVTPAATASITSDTTQMFFAPSTQLDTTQVTDLR